MRMEFNKVLPSNTAKIWNLVWTSVGKDISITINNSRHASH